MPQCQAKAKRTGGKQCRQMAVTGKRVCRVHGGLTPSGPAAGSFKHGLYSKHATAAFGPLMQDIQDDAELSALRDDLELYVALVRERLDGMQAGETVAGWKMLQKLFPQLRAQEAKRDVDGMMVTLSAMEDIIVKGEAAVAAREELANMLEQRSRIADRENKRLSAAHHVITVEQGMVILIAIANSIRQAVERASIDEKEKRGILAHTATAFSKFAGDDLLPVHHRGGSGAAGSIVESVARPADGGV